MRPSARSLEPLVPGSIFGVVLGAMVFFKGAADYRYALADLKEDPLYLRGPGPSIVIGVVASVVLLFVGIVIPAIHRDNQRAAGGRVVTPTSPVIAALGWVLVVAGGWGGYALGAVATVAAGGPAEHPGTMRLEIGAPLFASAEAAARCRTPPGQPRVVAILTSEAAGLRVQLLDPVTGAPQRYPAPTGVWVSSFTPSSAGGAIGWTSTRNGTVFERPPAGSLDTYLYNVTSADVGERSGRLVVSAERSQVYSGGVNEVIPGGGAPGTLTLALSWTCDIAATQPVPVSAGPLISPVRREADQEHAGARRAATDRNKPVDTTTPGA